MNAPNAKTTTGKQAPSVDPGCCPRTMKRDKVMPEGRELRPRPKPAT